MVDYTIPYYKWQSKLETNKKWEANEVEAMFIELMEQCRARSDGDETAEKLRADNKRLRDALQNIADLGLQILPVDKRWGTAFSFAREALKS